MTKRLSVTTPYMNWRNGQMVAQEDLNFEQTHNLNSNSAIVNNFFGSGLIAYSPTRQVIFDSSNLSSAQQALVTSNNFDGRGISPHGQPTDTSLGHQLEINLTGAEVSLRNSIKICIIGLDFEGSLQYEFFYFHKNEIQVSKKHFTNVITLLFNDFKGNQNCSKDLGGKIIIKEALPMQLSRDAITASQNLEPNLFFRDFKVVDQSLGPNPSTTLSLTLQAAIGSSYSVDSLNINTTWLNKKSLANDISTRFGQKFKAKVTNIQKVRVLLGVERNLSVPSSQYFNWSGNIILSIHALQTSVSCPTDVTPDDAIDFDPEPTALAQIVITQNTLAQKGITLTDVAQPIDFVFTNTKVGGYTNTGILKNNYYIVTIQRAGDASTGTIFTLTGRDFAENSVYSQFNGTSWTDDTTQDMWFEVYSDALKAADGMGYDAGNSLSIDKTAVNSNTGVTYDYVEDGIGFANNGQDVLNYTVAQSINDLITITQDERTGGNVYSQVTNKAELSSLTSSEKSSLESTEDPIILGCSYDINNKSSATLTGTQKYIGLTSSNEFCIVDPDAALKLYNLVGSVFTPNTANANSNQYYVYKTNLCIDGYGDLNGDSYVSYDDVQRANALLGEDINNATTQAKIAAGTISALEIIRADVDGDGVVDASDIAAINGLYTKDQSVILPYGATFERLCLYVENLNGRNDGYHSCGEGYARIYNPQPTSTYYTTLDAYQKLWYGYPVPVNIPGNESALTTVPFVDVNFRLDISPSWREEYVKVHSTGRLLPCTFTNLTGPTINDCSDPEKFYCGLLEKSNTCKGGENILFTPNLMIGDGGQILAPDGSNHKIDFESKKIILTLPDEVMINKSIDVFSVFAAEEPGSNGFTSYGYPAAKFADCSYVQSTALSNDQVRFNVYIASLNQQLDGYEDGYGYGIIADALLGAYMNQTTGVLTITSTNVNEDLTIPSQNCKIIIDVLLKKGGWVNKQTDVSPNEVIELFGL
jgi:hypothetical protein